MQRNVARAHRLVGGVDPWLMLSFVALTCIGILMVYSSSIADSYTYYGTPYYVFQREIVWVVLGFVGLSVAMRIHYQTWQRLALPIFGLSLLMLLAVLVPGVGHLSHGARRWFSIAAGVTVEPSELIKLSLVLYMAAWLTSKGESVHDFKRGFVPFSLIVGLVAILIVRQPDLGTAIIVTTTMFAVFFVAGAEMIHVVLVGAGASVIGWVLARSSSYRYDRLTAFMNPWKDPTGVGYHTVQVLLALGSGGLLGQGLGNSVQKNVLPAPHTDSILAVIGEEWGLVGTVAVLLLFIIIAYRGTRIVITAPDSFGKLLAAGITSWITFQALMNYAVITSSVPFTGVPLPYISYGGTSLIVTMTATGILLNISRHTVGEARARQDSHHGRGDRRPRVPRLIDHPVLKPVPDPAPRPHRIAEPNRGLRPGVTSSSAGRPARQLRRSRPVETH
ncbi:MAG: putative lipid II flippase FtsW [Chloroflexota bacterium]